MRKFLLFLVLFLVPSVVIAESTLTGVFRPIDEYNSVVMLTLTAHTDGSFVSRNIPSNVMQKVKRQYLREVYIDPDTPQPTSGTNLEIRQTVYGGADIFERTLYGLSATKSIRRAVPASQAFVDRGLTIVWEGNTVSGAKVLLNLFFRKVK